ncbi:MAG: phosphate acyltransferase PlsX [Oscillospiraceae bacterium]|nr:phosphate acyltransferase PlsX [Oscillospiraceae bacterium]MDY4105072.1 phosphate acyltransferase PlsX [Oscillospiraceae bacterium]
MKIIIDAMGGDHAPEEIVKGAVLARKQLGYDLILVGREADIRRCLAAEGAENDPGITVHHAPDVIDMNDDPTAAIRRKKESSMVVALNLLKDGEGDAVVSAGSTGALLTGATLIVRRIKGIRRAAMAPALPNLGAGALLIDCGANAECTPDQLVQFAHMGSLYAQRMLHVDAPRVALLNNGTEEHKGTPLQQESYQLLKNTQLNFVGNVEASQVLFGEVDVIVTDGFSGNILLKSIEGTAKFLLKAIKGVLMSGLKNKLAALMIKNDIGALKAMMDPNETGGTALLGISKPVIKAHGSSEAPAIVNAIRQAAEFAQSGFIQTIAESVETMQVEITQS